MTPTLRSRLALVLAAVLLLAGLGAAIPAPARADVPAAVATAPATAPFSAGLCEGQTSSDPRATGGATVPDLTRVFGQRLADYDQGRTVLLYGNTGTNGGTPNCGLRHVDGAGDVLEWMYCTDHDSEYCSVTNAGGALVQGSATTTVGSMADLEGNPRITAEQELAINVIVHHDLTLTAPLPSPVPVPDTGATVASNATSASRTARQHLVWCVSDRASLGASFDAWCEANVGTDAQRILGLVPDEPELSLEPASASVAAGTTARLQLTTNLFRQPIDLTTGGPVDAVQLCDPARGTIEGGTLTLEGDDASATTTVDLCVTSGSAGDVEVSAGAEAISPDTVSWAQAPGADGVVCQVYAYTVPGAEDAVATSARFTVTAQEPTDDDPTETPDTTTGDTPDDGDEPLDTTPAPGDQDLPDDAETAGPGGEATPATDAPDVRTGEGAAAVAGPGAAEVEGTGVLPVTGPGTAVTVAAGLGLVLLTAGAALVVANRRRHRPVARHATTGLR